MFSGIVEATGELLEARSQGEVLRLKLKKPSYFSDISLGDSIAVDGVCLTVEAFDSDSMTFALAAETLQVLKWNMRNWKNKVFNLERSLRYGDRIHGHLVTGHVDVLGSITDATHGVESSILEIELPPRVLPYVWAKGGMAINGVSLTINTLVDHRVSLCLIPETLKRTNLGALKRGDLVHIEADYMAKAIVRAKNLSEIQDDSSHNNREYNL